MAEQIQSPESSSCRTMTASAEWTNKYLTFAVIFRENNQIQLRDVYIFDSKYERMHAALARQVKYRSQCVWNMQLLYHAFSISSFREMSHWVCRNFPLEIDTCRDKVVLLISNHNQGFVREPVSILEKLGWVSMSKSVFGYCWNRFGSWCVCVWSDSILCD